VSHPTAAIAAPAVDAVGTAGAVAAAFPIIWAVCQPPPARTAVIFPPAPTPRFAFRCPSVARVISRCVPVVRMAPGSHSGAPWYGNGKRTALPPHPAMYPGSSRGHSTRRQLEWEEPCLHEAACVWSG
ncbi:hypothetical protein Vretimale_19093, partial [Volvox reticuliferus]